MILLPLGVVLASVAAAGPVVRARPASGRVSAPVMATIPLPVAPLTSFTPLTPVMPRAPSAIFTAPPIVLVDPARALAALPPLASVSSLASIPAPARAQWLAASVLADPRAAAAPSLEPAARALQDFLRDKPEMTERLAEIRREVRAGRVAGASEELGRIFDYASPARPSAAFAGAPLAAADGPGRRAAPLEPSRPDWTRGVFLPKTLDRPLTGDPLGVTVHRLKNGMTVYLSPHRGGEPRVSYKIAVRAGSRHDPLEATGMAHYLEHMQFKGSARLGTMSYEQEKPHLDRIEELYDLLFVTKDSDERARLFAAIDAESQAAARYSVPNELDKLYAAAGITEVNAHTFYEETLYHGSFPSNKPEVWARVETDRLSEPVYRTFLPELETVYEEYNRSLDNADQGFYGAALATLYKGHPYAREVIGLGEHLKNPSISRMRRFFRDHYRPNNMAIVLSGDFDPAAMLPLLERTFGGLTPAVVPAPPAGRVQKLRGVERTELRFQAQEALITGWQVPGRTHPDSDALELADKLLTNLLNVRVQAAQKVNQTYAHLQRLNEAGAWLLIGTPKEGQTVEQAERVLLDEVARFKAGDFSNEDLETALTQLAVEKKKALEKNDDRAAGIAQSFISGLEWEHEAGALERLKRLTREDVLRVSNQYLGGDRALVYRRKGSTPSDKVPKPVFTDVPLDSSRQSAFFGELMSLPAKPSAPRFLKRGRDYRTLDRAWGRLYTTKNAVNDLFSLEFRFPRGSAHERRLELALDLLMVSGAGDLTVEQFQRTLDRLGSSMEFECGESECKVKLSGLEENLQETLRLALLRFERPHVAPGAFADMIEVARGRRTDGKLDPQRVFRALNDYASRGTDSPRLKELSAAELDALTEAGLKDVLGSVFAYRRAVLYTGRRAPEQLAPILSGAHKRRRYQAPPAPPAVSLLKPSRPRVIFVHREGMQQAVLGAYAAGDVFDPSARLDQDVYNAVMGGGMGGIYFQEVREARALAYTAAGGYKPGARPGHEGSLWSYAGTQADKAVKTARLLLELMARPPVTSERFELARIQVEESLRGEVPQLSEVPEKVYEWERYGYASDPREASAARIGSYRRGRLDAFLAPLARRPTTLYVLGDRARVDVEALRALGDFEERSVDELFPY